MSSLWYTFTDIFNLLPIFGLIVIVSSSGGHSRFIVLKLLVKISQLSLIKTIIIFKVIICIIYSWPLRFSLIFFWFYWKLLLNILSDSLNGSCWLCLKTINFISYNVSNFGKLSLSLMEDYKLLIWLYLLIGLLVTLI